MKDFDAAAAVIEETEPYLETGPVFKPQISKSTVLQATAAIDGYLALPLGEELFESRFSAQGNDLLITLADESEVLVLRYFSQPQVPSLVNIDGAYVHAETVETLAGLKPLGSLFHSSHEPVATVSVAEGVVIVRREDGSRDSLNAGAQVFTGDILVTDIGAEVELAFRDGNAVTIIDAAMVCINRSSIGGKTVGYSVGLFKGSVDIATPSLEGTALEALTIHTPVASVYARPATRGHIHRYKEGYSFCLEAPQNELEGWMDIITRSGSRSLFQHTILMTVAHFNDIPKQQTNLKLAVTQPTIMTYPVLSGQNEESEQLVAEHSAAVSATEISERIIKNDDDLVKTNETVDGYDKVVEDAGAPAEAVAPAPKPNQSAGLFMTKPSSIFTLNQITGAQSDTQAENAATESQQPAQSELPPLPPVPPAPPPAAGLPPLPMGHTPPPIPSAGTHVFPPVSQSPVPPPPPVTTVTPPPVPAAAVEAPRTPAFINDAAAAPSVAAVGSQAEQVAPIAESAQPVVANAETSPRTAEEHVVDVAPTVVSEIQAPEVPAVEDAAPSSLGGGFAALEERLNVRLREEEELEAHENAAFTGEVIETTITSEKTTEAPSPYSPEALDVVAESVAVQEASRQEETVVAGAKPATPHTAEMVLDAISSKPPAIPAVAANEAVSEPEEAEAEQTDLIEAIAETESQSVADVASTADDNIAPEALLVEYASLQVAETADTDAAHQESAAADLLSDAKETDEASAAPALFAEPQADTSDAEAASVADASDTHGVVAVEEPQEFSLTDLPEVVLEEPVEAFEAQTDETQTQTDEAVELEVAAVAERVDIPAEASLRSEEPAESSIEEPSAEAVLPVFTPASAPREMVDGEPFIADRMVDLEGFSHKRLGFARVGDTAADLEISLRDEAGATQHRIVFKQFFKADAPKFQINVAAVPEDGEA